MLKEGRGLRRDWAIGDRGWGREEGRGKRERVGKGGDGERRTKRGKEGRGR